MTGLSSPRIGSRDAQRWQIDALIDARDGNHRVKAVATDISVSGLRLQTLNALRVGQTVWVELPVIELRQITVQWADGLVAGCAFAEPLADRVLDHILETAEASKFDVYERRKFPR